MHPKPSALHLLPLTGGVPQAPSPLGVLLEPWTQRKVVQLTNRSCRRQARPRQAGARHCLPPVRGAPVTCARATSQADTQTPGQSRNQAQASRWEGAPDLELGTSSRHPRTTGCNPEPELCWAGTHSLSSCVSTSCCSAPHPLSTETSAISGSGCHEMVQTSHTVTPKEHMSCVWGPAPRGWELQSGSGSSSPRPAVAQGGARVEDKQGWG